MLKRRLIPGRALSVALAGGVSASLAQPARGAANPLQESWRVETIVAEIDGGTGGLTLGADGTLYSSEFGDKLGGGGRVGTRVWAISPAGEVSVFADGLDGASGSAIDSHGTFFQSNIRGGSVTRIPKGGTPEIFVSEGIQSPVGIEVDPDDNLYVANCGSSSIQKITPVGESSRFVESDLLQCLNGITRDTDRGDFYVANFMNGDVIKISSDGEASKLTTLPGNNNGHLIYHDGSLYVVGRMANQIFRVGLDGTYSAIAGSGERGAADGPALEATLSLPNDIAISPDGSTLYINEIAPLDLPHTELAPTRIRKIVRVTDS
ncbi:MAG: hypothetical protein GKS06_09930 [Acidobacteria bacterium]|nr:hypothetical protein [Acidobacteriota bacterium]